MAKKKTGSGKASGEQELLTLAEVSRRTGISKVSLHRYKNEQGGRIPVVMVGKRAKYPLEALEVFSTIKEENLARRGRPAAESKPKRRKAAGKRQARKKAASGSQAGTMNITELAEAADVSLATLRKYRKEQGDRIPKAGGTDSRPRFGPEAIEVVKQIKAENIANRGGGSSEPAEEVSATEAKKGRRLLSLKEIERITGISYSTLHRDVKENLSKIPHVVEGKTRKYLPEAVEVFKSLRQRGAEAAVTGARKTLHAAGEASVGVARLMRSFESAVNRLEARMASLEKELKRPIKLEVKRD